MTEPDPDYYGTFAGRWISKAMELGQINQRELAEKVGVSRSHISRILNGRIDPPCSLVCRLVEACGCEIKHLAVKVPESCSTSN